MENERDIVDDDIVNSLYSLEVKLKDGQERSKTWKEMNIRGKA